MGWRATTLRVGVREAVGEARAANSLLSSDGESNQSVAQSTNSPKTAIRRLGSKALSLSIALLTSESQFVSNALHCLQYQRNMLIP